MLWSSAIAATMDDGLVSPKEGRKNYRHLAALRLQPLPLSPEETQDVKQRILVPDRRCAYQKIDFIEPRFLHPPIHKKC